ncbi:DEAD/DEAH box helicase domain-containing protein [Alishewanella agri BL06]|uniref:DEAD-box ATP-dependent RNA helicase RhpA n=1 Tax=Alishewanella agri BL06 TaxID=1195246 RepID=I9DT32_9ALTE|nr:MULTISPECIES: DEAD/DEAH box helicase [Alishewanella]EIW89260.1 DEAD/DEAH box helicase domain-containing protein [Alishewanella agri BL06]KRS22709.1 ATP-dependent RNA helicase RhlE [Alishewanella sp. WH16-1]
MQFQTLALAEPILRVLAEQGYQAATPVQQQAIPPILSGKDVLAGAQTGTGKTAAFTLPLLQQLLNAPKVLQPAQVRVLVLTPTRELAQQVFESVQTYSRYLSVRCAVFYGGVSIRPQYDEAEQGLDILVATPGRLIDHLHQQTIDLSQLEVLVLDEADRMLDMGFIVDIKRIMAKLPAQRQTLLFSATYSKEIKILADELLNKPVLIEVATANATADRVTQQVYLVDRHRKRELISHMIGMQNWPQVLIFVRTKHGADRLAKQLQKDGLTTAAIHGDKAQGARQRALDEFKQGKVRILVATDIAARGLDISELPYVVNYDLPQVAEDYVHRIGRTGRAGLSGVAVTLVGPDELGALQDIEKLTQQVLPTQIVPGYEHDPSFQPPEEQLARKPGQRPGARHDGPAKKQSAGKLKAKLRAKALGKA